MDLLSVLTIFGGLAFFLYGMHVMSENLEKLSGGRFESIITTLTSGKLKSVFWGTAITAAMQSSSAVTVMLVGFVNSGIIPFENSLGIIFGSNIGTTLTAWILSLAGIKNDSIFFKIFNPAFFTPVIAIIGILFVMIPKKQLKKDIGSILIGFSILMYGMELMTGTIGNNINSFSYMLTKFQSPILCLIMSMLFTAIIQSSAATIGMVQALTITENLTFTLAACMVLGANIGTCMTAYLSSFGTNKNAKRVVAAHVYMNVIGTLLFLIIFYGLKFTSAEKIIESPATSVSVAAFHTIFNVATTAVLFPFYGPLIKLIKFSVRSKK